MRSFSPLRRLESSFLGRCLGRFRALEGLDRALVLSAQAFTAIIPLLLLLASLSPADERGGIAEAIITRFSLEGAAAEAVTALFARPASATGGVSLLSLVLVVFSALSFTRRMQRMYQRAWELPELGVRGSVDAAMGLAALLLEVAVLYLARALVSGLPMDRAFEIPLTLAVGTLLWTSVPWLLLDRRLHWRRLLPAGGLAALGSTLYGVATSVYMPGLIERYSQQYGVFGVTIALVGWLLAIALILVVSTVVGVELDRGDEAWVRRLRRRIGLEEPAVAEDRR